MIEIEEQGRRLKITVGGEEEFLVRPVDGETGAALLSGWLSIIGKVFGNEDQLELDMLTGSVGEENVERVQALRPSEIHEVTMSAFFWQTAGGIAAARAFSAGDSPKAIEVLAEQSGLPLLSVLLSGGSESPTSQDGTPATTTPDGFGSGSPAEAAAL